MPKRRKILLAALACALVLGAVLCFAFLAPTEPSYKGKTLSEWVALEVSPIEEVQKAEAIRRIGTNAIPYLLKWLNYYEPPRWKQKLYEICGPFLKDPRPDQKLFDRSMHAADAFQFLGKDAFTAIPELRILAIANKPGSSAAMHALAMLGKDGLPPLMEALTNSEPTTRSLAVISVLQMGTNAQPAVPLVINLLNDTNSQVVEVSASFLRGLINDPDTVISVLTKSLQSTKPHPNPIIHVLGLYGIKARSAVPTLLQLLNNQSTHQAAYDALQSIDPEALKRATQK